MKTKTIQLVVQLTPLQQSWLLEAPTLQGVSLEEIVHRALAEALQPPPGWRPAAERGRARILRLITQEDH